MGKISIFEIWGGVLINGTLRALALGRPRQLRVKTPSRTNGRGAEAALRGHIKLSSVPGKFWSRGPNDIL